MRVDERRDEQPGVVRPAQLLQLLDAELREDLVATLAAGPDEPEFSGLLPCGSGPMNPVKPYCSSRSDSR